MFFCGWHIDTTIESFALACPRGTNVQFLDLYISDFYLISSSSEAQNLRNPFANNKAWMWNVWGLTRWHIYWILCISIHQEFPSSISSSSISSTSLRYLQVLKLQLSFANNICPKICSDMNVKRLGSDMLTHLLNLLHYYFTNVPSSIS